MFLFFLVSRLGLEGWLWMAFGNWFGSPLSDFLVYSYVQFLVPKQPRHTLLVHGHHVEIIDSVLSLLMLMSTCMREIRLEYKYYRDGGYYYKLLLAHLVPKVYTAYVSIHVYYI